MTDTVDEWLALGREQYVAGIADEIAEKVAVRLGANRPLLTIRDLADRLTISERSARTLVEGDRARGIEPVIPSVRVGGGGGSVRIDPAEVDRYVRSRQDRTD